MIFWKNSVLKPKTTNHFERFLGPGTKDDYLFPDSTFWISTQGMLWRTLKIVTKWNNIKYRERNEPDLCNILPYNSLQYRICAQSFEMESCRFLWFQNWRSAWHNSGTILHFFYPLCLAWGSSPRVRISPDGNANSARLQFLSTQQNQCMHAMPYCPKDIEIV